MKFRNSFAVGILAGLFSGLAGHAHAQSTLPLKGTLQEDPSLEASVQTAGPGVTSLEIRPLAPAEPPPVRRRMTDDPYAATGIGQGGLRLYPAITATAVYSSNANGSSRNARAAAGLRLQPDLRVESDWSRHSWTAGLKGDWINYAGLDNAETSNLDIFQRLRLDARRTTSIEAETRYNLDKPEARDAAEQTLSGSLAIVQDFGPMTAKVSAGARQKYFGETDSGSGGARDNSDLDYLEPSLALRATYNAYGSLKPYLEASLVPRFHDRESDRFGLNRDSMGQTLGAGLVIDAGPIWSGDLGLTYLHRNYQARRLESASAVGLNGSVTWSPEELTKIVVSAGTGLEEVASGRIGARPTWTASVRSSFAVRDNVDLLSGLSAEIEGTGGDSTYGANLGVSWRFNPVLSWTAGYDIIWLDSARPGGDYLEHRISAGLTVSR